MVVVMVGVLEIYSPSKKGSEEVRGQAGQDAQV